MHDSIGVGGWGGGQKVGRPVPRVVANRAGSILGEGFFFCESSAKMRLFGNLGIINLLIVGHFAIFLILICTYEFEEVKRGGGEADTHTHTHR